MKSHRWIVFGLLISLSFSGCSLLNKRENENLFGTASDQPEKIKFGEPVKMAVIWKDSTFTAPGTPPTRGFGGRFYFFNKKNKPIRVDGKLMIYAYDDSDESQKTQADRRYEYEAKDFQKHYSETDIGHSYSIWVPWDKIGGYRKTITLIPMFTAKSGQVVRGGQDIVVLPGKATKEDQMNKLYRGIQSPNGKLNVTYASKQVNYDGPPINPRRMDTTTINLPKTMQQRLNQNNSATQAAPPEKRELPPGITQEMINELRKHQPKGSLPVSYGSKPAGNTQPVSPNPNVGPALTGGHSPGAQPATNSNAAAPNTMLPKRNQVFGAPGSFR